MWQWSAAEAAWKTIDTTEATTAERAPLTHGEFDGQVYDGILDQRFASKAARDRAKREKDDEYLSDFLESEDDETTELTYEGQLDILTRKGKEKKRKFAETFVVTQKEGQYQLSDPHQRKIYSAHRTTKKSKIVDSSRQHLVLIGQQQLRMGEGTGHYVQPGGNTRPETIKEPDAAYEKFFETLKILGNDAVADALYLAATGSARDKSAARLTDAEAAAMALYYINNDAAEIESKLGKRTQLTEHLSKFAGISGLAEQSRAFEAVDTRKEEEEEAPYDASLFVKQGLLSVSKGTHTLKEMFYKGKKGSESIFLGAPTQDTKGAITGGSEQLRDPFGNRKALERQMALFKPNKREYKKQLNDLRTGTKVSAPKLTKEHAEAQKKKMDAERLKSAQALTARIKRIPLPAEKSEVLDFTTDRSGPIKKHQAEIARLKRVWASDSAVLEELARAQSALNDKAKAAKALL